MSEGIVIEDVVADLRRIQDFDPTSLVRRDELGAMLSFDEAVEPARRVIQLFRKLPAGAIEEFPATQLRQIQNQSKSSYTYFDNILKFNPKVGDAETQRTTLIDQLKSSYQPAFDLLFPYISFAIARTVDFGSLEERGRAAIQSINDDRDKVLKELKETSENAMTVLNEVREAAAEQGVTQQARYFADEAKQHTEDAKRWLVASVIVAIVVLLYAIFTFFLPFIEMFKLTSTPQAVQFVSGKLLVFLVLAFALFQGVKNYGAHRHNAVTNKHRQNALMTYKTLAEAGNTPEARDTILQHAAAAIYAPADTGYLKAEDRGYGSSPIVGISPKSLLGSASSADGS